MAQAVGIHGIRLEEPADVETGIMAAFAHEGPVLIDAVVNRDELSIPPKITVEMAKGFTLYMVKAVMSGRADEVFDLAATNLWRGVFREFMIGSNLPVMISASSSGLSKLDRVSQDGNHSSFVRLRLDLRAPDPRSPHRGNKKPSEQIKPRTGLPTFLCHQCKLT